VATDVKQQFEREKKIHAWFLAARPKTFIIALTPVLIASALGFGETAQFNWVVSLCTFLSAFLFQVGTNLVNDALDFKKGADTEKRLGFMRVTQAGLLPFAAVYRGGLICFALGALTAIPLIISGGWPFVAIVVSAILSGYLYTGGPYPLAYNGLGELFVLLFYGGAAVNGVFYLQTHTLNSASLIAALQAGMLATMMISIVNLRDIVEDSTVNKRTLAVRFGKTFGRCQITLFAMAPFALTLLWFPTYPLAAILPFLAFPLAIRIVRSIWTHEPSRAYNTFFAQGAMLLLFFTITLSLGFLL